MSSSPKDLAKPVAIVVTHAKARGIQLGAGVGLAIATPALLLAPERANPSDAPPLVAAAAFAATGAAVGGAVAGASAIARLARSDAAGIHKRGNDLLANERQRRLDKIGCGGMLAGLLLEGLRVRELARTSGKCVYGLTFSRQTAWEAFGFAAAGAAVAVGTATAVAVVRRKLDCCDDAGDDAAPPAEVDETEPLVDGSTAAAVAQNVDETIEKAASAASAAADGN